MRHLLFAVCLSTAFVVFSPSRASAQGYYYGRPVSNVWHPRSSAYLSRPTYHLVPRSFGPRYNFNYNYNYGYRGGYRNYARGGYNARPSNRYNARPSNRYNARPSNRYNARPRF